MPLYFGIPGDPGSEPRSRNEPDRPPAPIDLIAGRDVERPTVEPESPSFFGEVLPAAFRQGNLISSMYDRVANYPGGFTFDPNFDPGEHIEGHEADWRHFVRAGSVEEVQFIKDKLAAERQDREVLQQAGGLGLATTIAAGVVDPWTLASMALPAALPAKVTTAAGTVVNLTRAQRVWGAVAANAALDTAGEIGMHNSQELRTLSDSLLTIGAGTLLTGAVGAIATRVPKAEFDRVVRGLEEADAAARTAARVGGDSGGAARVGDNLSLEDEGIATAGGRAVAATFGRISPLTRVLRSPVKSARQLIQSIGHVPYLLEKNLRGIANQDSIEDLVNATLRTRRSEMRKLLDTGFAQHKAAGGTLSHRQFSAAVARELDGIAQPMAPEAKPIVQWARERLNEDRARIRAIPGFEDFGKEIDADKYFPRAYDRERIQADLAGFQRMLYNYFKDNPKIPEKGAVEREKLIAARRQGVNDATINLEIAEREAADAVKAFEDIKAKLAQAQKEATGRGGAQDMAHRAKRTAQAKRREAAKLKRQLDKLSKRLESMEGETPPRLEVEIDAEMAVKRARRDELKKSIGAIKTVGRKTSQAARRMAAKVRSTAARATRLEAKVTELLDSGDPKAFKQAEKLDKAAYDMRQQADAAARDLASARSQTDELRAQLEAAKKELDDLSDELFDLRTEKAIGRSKTTKAETLENLRGQKLNRAADAADELRDAEAVAKQLKQRAVTARKLMRALKRPAKEARRAKIKAEYVARKAVVPQFDEAETLMRVRDTVKHILGENDVLTPDNVHSSAKALKERTLDAPSELLDPWLVRDAEAVFNRYSRRMVPEIELRTRYGSSTLSNEISMISDEFQDLIDKAAAAGKTKEVEKLKAQREKAIEDILTVLNRVAGRSGNHNASSFVRRMVRVGRIARTYNYVRLLGSQTVSSLSDTGRLVMRYGLPSTLRATAKFLTNWPLARMSKADAQRMGTALEMMTDFRMQQMADLAEEMPISRTDKALEAVSGAFSRATLMTPWNAMLKVGVSALEQDSIVRLLQKETLSVAEKAKLTRAGIDDVTIKRVKEMLALHADDSDGLWRLRTELWEDEDVAARMERHIMSIGDEIVLTRGAGDVPAIMDNEFVKTWLQFRTFALASVNRTLIPVAQGLSLADGKTAQGVATMLATGAATYALKEKIAGREADLSPSRLAAEAANWSGLIAFLPDLWDPIAKGTDLPTFSRFMSRNTIETLAGPTMGSTLSMLDSLKIRLLDGELKQEDIHGLRRALPFQNLFYITRVLNAIEGELGERLGAENADTMDFTDRLQHEIPFKEPK